VFLALAVLLFARVWSEWVTRRLPD
jgi:hypothetical protein